MNMCRMGSLSPSQRGVLTLDVLVCNLLFLEKALEETGFHLEQGRGPPGDSPQ